MSPQTLRWSILLAATVGAVYLCGRMILPFAGVILWSVILVIGFQPLHVAILNRLRRPDLSALLTSLLVALIILVPVAFLTGLLVAELLSLKTTISAKLSDGFQLTDVVWLRRVLDWVHINPNDLPETLRANTSRFAQYAAKFSLALVGSISGMIVSFVFSIFTMYYLFRDGVSLAAAVPDYLPLEHWKSEELLTRVRDVVNGGIYGVFVIAAIQGVLGGLSFWVLGVPSPVLWGVAMAFASLIPLIGTTAVWLPGAVFLLITGAWLNACILAAFGALVIGSVDNFLRPMLVSGRARIHELVMFFSVLGGLQIFGLIGIVAGPAIFAIAGSLIEAIRNPGKLVEE